MCKTCLFKKKVKKQVLGNSSFYSSHFRTHIFAFLLIHRAADRGRLSDLPKETQCFPGAERKGAKNARNGGIHGQVFARRRRTTSELHISRGRFRINQTRQAKAGGAGSALLPARSADLQATHLHPRGLKASDATHTRTRAPCTECGEP